MPPFRDFYQALNDRSPFPWQSRLAAQVEREGKWPREIGVPTGLGKTACLDIAVWWLASQADRCPSERTAPTRIWWLVNRRLLVDSTYEHAERIRCALLDAAEREDHDQHGQPLGRVARRLRALGADPHADPLEVIRLRGGVRSHRPVDPSRPAVIMSTIPMYGSRLLFRGYGSTRLMRPVDAALAGTDSLLLVDEAHLARHLLELVPALEECAPNAKLVLGERRTYPQVVALTATGDAAAGDRFVLDGADEKHPLVSQRLDADKPLEARHESGNVSRRLAEATQRLLAKGEPAATCLVFANSPATARATHERLETAFRRVGADVLLLTGRMREREAERIRNLILDPVDGMTAGRPRNHARERHLIVVATQTLEVGADLDAEYLVTEQCGVRALTQRLGRLNRLGAFPHARAVYVHMPSQAKKRAGAKEATWPVYGAEPATVIRRLEVGRDADQTVPLSPRSAREVLGAPGDDPGRAPEILKGILWEWTKTTTPPEGEAPVEPYFQGIADADYSVSFIWRTYVPGVGERLWPRAADGEAISVPIGEARQALGEDTELRVLDADHLTMTSVTARDVRPGAIIVLSSECGLMDEFGWNPDATSPVVDISLGTHGVPLDADAIRRLTGASIGGTIKVAVGDIPDDEDVDEVAQTAAVQAILGVLHHARPTGWEDTEWRDLVSALKPEVVSADNEVSRLPVDHRSLQRRSDELDERSLAGTATDLELHCQAVGARSRGIAERLGLAAALADTVAEAGQFHDLGKADRRFQRWLDPGGRRSAPVAKSNVPQSRWSATRKTAGWPQGGRHEALSARIVQAWMARHPEALNGIAADLLLHLVVSHHGYGRPLVPPVDDAYDDQVRACVRGDEVSVSARLAVIDWTQPGRFWALSDRFGPWGLALLETIVRQADHAVSSGAHVHELEEGA